MNTVEPVINKTIWKDSRQSKIL